MLQTAYVREASPFMAPEEVPLLQGDAEDLEEQCQQAKPIAHSFIRPEALAPALALIAVVLFCLNGELLQALQLWTPPHEKHASPLLNLLLCHLGGIVFAPQFIGTDNSFGPPTDTLGLMSGSPTGVLGYLSARPKISALIFALLLTGYNYAWLLSTRFVSMAVTNATFQVSVALVYAASVPLFGEPLEFSRMFGVGLVLFGSMLASGIIGGSVGDVEMPVAGSASTGVALALLAAVGVALYQVLFRHLFGHLKHEVRFLTFFSCWIGVWHIIVVAPLIWIASIVGYEALEFPSGLHTVIGTVVSAAIASTVNILYLCIALWGAPMLLPCVSVFSVPLTVALDTIFHGKNPQAVELGGHAMVVMAVVLILNLQKSFTGAPARGSKPL